MRNVFIWGWGGSVTDTHLLNLKSHCVKHIRWTSKAITCPHWWIRFLISYANTHMQRKTRGEAPHEHPGQIISCLRLPPLVLLSWWLQQHNAGWNAFQSCLMKMSEELLSKPPSQHGPLTPDYDTRVLSAQNMGFDTDCTSLTEAWIMMHY